MNCSSSYMRIVRFNLKRFYIITIQVIWFVLVTQSSANSDFTKIAMDDGLLSISAQDAPLEELLGELADKLDVEFQIHGEIDHTITLNFSRLSLEKGLKRLLDTENVIIVYSESYLPDQQTNIEKIIIYSAGKGNRGGMQKISGKSNLVNPISQTGQFNTNQTMSLQAYAKLLSDPDPDIREDAVIDMADEYKEAAFVYLEKALLEDGNDDVRMIAAEVIGELESERGIKSLEKGLDDPSEKVREAVVNALGEIGSEKVLPALQKALEDRNEDIREEAAYLIEDIGEQETTE